jgi:hypothetical protein
VTYFWQRTCFPELSVTRPSKFALTVGPAFLFSVLAFAAVLIHLTLSGAQHSLPSPFLTAFAAPANNAVADSPAITFWAWERREDFRFLKPGQASVAFLAETIYLSSRVAPAQADSAAAPALTFSVRPRLQPLRVKLGTPLTAVVRIEARPAFLLRIGARSAAPPSPENVIAPDLREHLASEIAGLQSLPGISAIQIDFDAPSSFHPSYAALLEEVRRKLPSNVRLSITALASWCIGDPWLAQLPRGTIDEAIPMLFRMGPDTGDVLRFLHSGKEFPVSACRSSLGLSTDEPLSREILAGKFPSLAGGSHRKRIYVFSPRAQTESAALSILEEWLP